MGVLSLAWDEQSNNSIDLHALTFNSIKIRLLDNQYAILLIFIVNQ